MLIVQGFIDRELLSGILKGSSFTVLGRVQFFSPTEHFSCSCFSPASGNNRKYTLFVLENYKLNMNYKLDWDNLRKMGWRIEYIGSISLRGGLDCAYVLMRVEPYVEICKNSHVSSS
jgi:hypothetical protein